METVTIPKAHFEQLIEDITKTSGFLTVYWTLINRLGLVEAAILSNYMDKHVYFKTKNPNSGGWFFLKLEKQQAQLNIPKKTLIRAKASFIKRGILKTKWKGIPGKEWYWLDHYVIYQLITDSEEHCEQASPVGATQASPVGETLINNNKPKNNKEKKLNNILRADATESEYDTNNSFGSIKRTRPPKSQKMKRTIKSKVSPPKETVSMAPPANKPPKKEDTPIPYIPLAQQLSDTIRTKKNMTHTPSQIKTWAKEMEKLHKQNNIDIPRQQEALDWYDKNIGQPYIPVIESGKSFREKFGSLDAAITRSKQFQFNKPQVKAPANAYRGKEVNQGLLDLIHSTEKSFN